MAIQIGERTLHTRTPPDLDAAVAHTGLSGAEIAAQLARGGYASHVATALLPFVMESEAPTQPELAAMIEADDLDRIRGEVRALYDTKADKDGDE